MDVGFVLEEISDMSIRALPNVELLAVILGKRSAKQLYSGSLVRLFQPTDSSETVHPKLEAAHELVRRWLLESLRDSPAFENPASLSMFLKAHLRDRPYEAFCVVFLDTRHRIILIEDMFHGSIDSATVHPREVVRKALQVNAAAVVLVHNHPSGVAEPSAADSAITRRIVDACALVDVRVLDHFVVGDVDVVSMAARGLM